MAPVEARAWNKCLRQSGLRAPDLIRRFIRLGCFLQEAQDRGATIQVTDKDGTVTQLAVF